MDPKKKKKKIGLLKVRQRTDCKRGMKGGKPSKGKA